MAAENVISYDTDTIQSIVNTDISGLSSLNASTYSDEYLTQDFIAKIFDKLNVGDQSALNRWNTVVNQVNGYITSLEETPVPDDVTADSVVNEAPPIGDEAPLPEEEDPVAETLQRVLDGELGPDTPHINPETLAAGVGIGLGAGIGTNPIDGVQPADVEGTPGVDFTTKPGIDVNTDPRFQAPKQQEVPTEPTVEPAKEPGKPAIDVTTDPRFQAPPQPEKPVEQPTVTPQPDVPTQPVEQPTQPEKPGIDVTTDPRFQAPKKPETPTQPDKPSEPPKKPTQPQQPTTPSFEKTNVFDNLASKFTGGNGQQQITLGMNACKSYMETNNLTTEQFMMGVNDGSIVLTDPNALSFMNILKSSASSDYGTISSTEALIEMLVKLFTILM